MLKGGLPSQLSYEPMIYLACGTLCASHKRYHIIYNITGYFVKGFPAARAELL